MEGNLPKPSKVAREVLEDNKPELSRLGKIGGDKSARKARERAEAQAAERRMVLGEWEQIEAEKRERDYWEEQQRNGSIADPDSTQRLKEFLEGS
jgi:hypothetical protein